MDKKAVSWERLLSEKHNSSVDNLLSTAVTNNQLLPVPVDNAY